MAGESYSIETVQDMAKVYASLPMDRRELFLREMADAIKTIATFSPIATFSGPFTWIDDDKSRATLNLHADLSDEPLVTARFKI